MTSWARVLPDRGSALIEALIGVAIVSLTLSGMYHAIIDSALRNRMAEDRRTASLIAQSELASVGSLVPLEPGVTSGIQDGYRWHIEIEPYSGTMPPSNSGSLMNVTVSVNDARNARLVSLHTLAIGVGG